MRTITIGPWLLEVDSEATANAYRCLPRGSAVACGCTDCKNWLEQRELVLPPEFFSVLTEIGIDANKETELSEYEGGQVEPGMNLYWGEYLFVGRVLFGPECYVTQPNGKGCSVDMQPIFESVRIGLSSNIKWARQAAEFPEKASAVLAFQVRAKRGAAYA